MELKSGKILYHGSNVPVSNIDLSVGNPRKDFGKGFYTTASKAQAEKFARIKTRRAKSPEKSKKKEGKEGYVSVFSIRDVDDLRIKVFESANAEWLDFVAGNRTQKNMVVCDHDIIIGPVANDAVGTVVNFLIDGIYGNPNSDVAKKTAIGLLKTERLYNQVFFRTMKAIEKLAYREAYKIEVDK